ncbi:unnamed protein product [Rotaria socialis]|uniref:mannan endo-1,4-beta-mannosidase n=1 Tax=Rotaria socialis TaxID=392032 RepID=A0A821SZT7_9BILA|nr:unnamed protein product [Rotaria socialis]CAF4862439.1 unnamed protein product [Rotaria socialis]
MLSITCVVVLVVHLVAIVESLSFVKVKNARLSLDDHTYIYVGTNFWYGANLGSLGPGGDRERLKRELDHLHELGVNNLRVQAGSEGPDTEPWRIIPSLQPSPGEYNLDVLDGLDFLLSEMSKRQMRAVMCLNNFWHWSGGFAQYIAWADGPGTIIPYPATDWFDDHIRFLLSRKNRYTNVAYTSDPTIMSWELANEPRRLDLSWVNRTACLLKELAPRQLVTTGVEGKISSNNFSNDHASPCVDYATFHLWVQNWNIFDPHNASATLPLAIDYAKNYIDFHAAYKDKPIVLEEFGISRDNGNYMPTASVTVRNQYYRVVLTHSRSNGVPTNFWAYGGEGRPRIPAANWSQGDDFTGDPPHEPQGWYSVYNDDRSTLDLIKEFATTESTSSTTRLLFSISICLFTITLLI